uniref:Pyrin domain-containing protein n=1 Tax=Echeneis naucrates TaxID=173247 RepID=A0A665SUL8_ECHNA
MTSQVLLAALDDLRRDEFQRFKWHLAQGDSADTSIPTGRLEDAERWTVVDLMEQTFTALDAVNVVLLIQNHNHKPINLDLDSGSVK